MVSATKDVMTNITATATEDVRDVSTCPVLCVTLNPALDLTIALSSLTLGKVNRAQGTQLEAAGKGINVARVLASLGHPVTLTGFLGDENQTDFTAAFAEWGLTDAFERVPGATRINVKLGEGSGRVTDINGTGMQVDATAFACLETRIDAWIDQRGPGGGRDDERPRSAVVIAGSLPPGITHTQLSSLISRVQAQSVDCWLDTSGAALEAGLTARPTAVKPNEQELALWAGEPLDSDAARERALSRLGEHGIREALISAGPEGVLWASPGADTLRARPPRMQVVSTVCAGDTLLAAMLHGVLCYPAASSITREQILRFATALSAEAVTHPGPGNPLAPQMKTLQQHTSIETLVPADIETAGEPRQ